MSVPLHCICYIDAILLQLLCLQVLFRSARVHWGSRVWPNHLLPAFNLLAVGQEAQNYQLAFLGVLGLHHSRRYHHNLWSYWWNARHHCRCLQLQVLHLSTGDVLISAGQDKIQQQLSLSDSTSALKVTVHLLS